VDDAEPPIRFVEVARPSGGATVMVVGELAFDTVPIFRRRIAAILDGGQNAPLEIDLSTVEFCDAAGLTALEKVADTAVDEQLEVRIAAASSCFDVLLELCQIPGLLGYTPSRTTRVDFARR
jgi:anti-anti-sigma regulatory factor